MIEQKDLKTGENQYIKDANEDFDKRYEKKVRNLWQERLVMLKRQSFERKKTLSKEEAVNYAKKHGFLKTERGAYFVDKTLKGL